MEWRTFDMEWVPIKGYKYPYRINEEARVQKFYNGKWVDLSTKLHGSRQAVQVCMRTVDGEKKMVGLNSLMADAFLGGRRPGYKIIHKNGMKSDCAVENLEFVTIRECGSMYGKIGRRKSVLKVDKNGELLAVYHSALEAAKANFISETQVKKHCRGIIQNPFKFMDFTFCYDK